VTTVAALAAIGKTIAATNRDMPRDRFCFIGSFPSFQGP
jgi:hypothetical protein